MLKNPDPIRVWDPFVRLFHWILVGLFALAFITGEKGGSWHDPAGYAIAGLVALRLIWGFVGSRYARFADFIYGPKAVANYLRNLLRGRPRRFLGHNPAGGVMIILLLLLLAVSCVSGWLLTTYWFFGSELMEELHELSTHLALAGIIIHVLGVIVASVLHRENLILAMITGRKPPS
jgi:cytochrome b